MIPNDITSAVQVYVQTQSGGAVFKPVNDSWVQAYCEHLGVTSAVNMSWIQALCIHFGVTQPRNMSWVQALAQDYYGLTQPLNNSWWFALANLDAPVSALVWNSTTTNWEAEFTQWNA